MQLFCIHIIYIWVVIKVVGIKNNIKTCYLGYATFGIMFWYLFMRSVGFVKFVL